MTLFKTYQIYIIKSFLKYILILGLVFLSLAFIINILEEIKFFRKLDLNFLYPLFLTFLNTPSILFEIFPFIFLLSTQFLFLNFYEKDEITLFKNFGLSNTKIIKSLCLFSLLLGFLINILFYSFSSEMKYAYLAFKNKFTTDNKYLAMVNQNGLWIKDEIKGKINIINAEKFDREKLWDITIIQLDKNFDLERTILAEEAYVDNKVWNLNSVKIFKENNQVSTINKKDFVTNFDREKINNSFSNLTSLNFIKLINLFNDYKSIGYSTLEIEIYFQKLLSFPFYMMIMTLIGAIIMFNLKNVKSKFFNGIIGILVSVLIYYIVFFFNLFGTNEKIPVVASIWLPLLILMLVCFYGLVRINEK